MSNDKSYIQIITTSGLRYDLSPKDKYKIRFGFVHFTITERYYDYGTYGKTTSVKIPLSSIASIEEIVERNA